MTTGLTRAIRAHYPHFVNVGPFINAPESWLGKIRPFAECSAAELPSLLDDLRAGAPIHMREGHLLHDPDCERKHQRFGFLEGLGNVSGETFTVRLVVWPPPTHPKVMSIFPEISARIFPNHPHLFRHGFVGIAPEIPNIIPDALCTYRPGDGDWAWARSDLVLSLDFASIFLAKHVVWERTGGNRDGFWIGPHASHHPRDLVRELNPEGECRCGSGRNYEACCRPFDVARANAAERASAAGWPIRRHSETGHVTNGHG